MQNLSVVRGERHVISDLNFEVRAGEALIVKGTNGSGKTTLLRTLAGFLKPQSGLIKGHLPDEGEDDEPVLREHIHYVGHLNAIKASQTVLETLHFYADFFGDQATPIERVARIDDALAQFQLEDLTSIPNSYLSAGQQRRLGLARLLCAPRPIWLLDEPTTSLDQKNSAALTTIIKDHLAHGGLVVAATHLDLGLVNATVLQLDTEAA